MRWRARDNDWRRRFAFLPLTIEGWTIWLEGYWARPCGEYTEVSFEKDRPTPSKDKADG